MTNPLTFEALQAILHRHTDQLSDYRKGQNTQYRIQDAALGAFGIFFTQSPGCKKAQTGMQAQWYRVIEAKITECSYSMVDQSAWR